MKKVIRHGAFETNSSSTHSLVYINQTLRPSELVLDNGVLVVDLDEYCDLFCKEHYDYVSQKDKLAYICKYICGKREYYDDEEMEDMYEFETLKDALKKHTGCEDLKIIYKKELKFDHQTAPYYGEACVVDLWDEEEILYFIFNENIVLRVGTD